MEILSTFTYETATWDKGSNTYINRRTRSIEKVLFMKVNTNLEGKKVLKFEGGPTGFESYYISDLLENKPGPVDKNTPFCICGGTVNSWPRAVVLLKEVLDFITSLPK